MKEPTQIEIDDFIKATAANLSEFLSDHDVEKEYKWKPDKNTRSQAKQLLDIELPDEGSYSQTVNLMEALRSRMKECDDFPSTEPFAKFVISDWGGIGKRKKEAELPKLSDELREKLKKLFNEKEVDLKLSKSISAITNISSWSKYLSILREGAAIYDSRVAFSINTVNLLRGELRRYFHMPDSRSHRFKMVSPEMFFLTEAFADGRINEQEIDWEATRLPSDLRSKFHLDKNKTYACYLDILEMVAKETKKSEHDIEMLLFALAPNVLFEQLVTYARNNR